MRLLSALMLTALFACQVVACPPCGPCSVKPSDAQQASPSAQPAPTGSDPTLVLATTGGGVLLLGGATLLALRRSTPVA